MINKRPLALLPLEKGQLWKTKTGRIEIMNVGKLLAHYRYFAEGQKRVSTTMTRVRLIQDYLVANGGRLIKNGRLKISS